MKLDRLASDIADRIIHKHCDIAVRHAIQDDLLGMLGLKRRRPRKPNWRARDRFLAPYERRVASTLQGIWDKERRTVLVNMKRSPLKAMRKDSSFIDSWLYPRATYEELIRKGVSKELAQLLASSIPRIIGEFGLDDVSFEVVNQHALEWLREYTPKLSENLEQINTDDLRRTLMEGIDGGEDMRKLRDRVDGLFDEYDRERAERIARTETIRAQEEGNQEVYKEAGFERKVWMANSGACGECEALNDVDVSINESYGQDVFGEDMMTPPLHPNCRCASSPWMEEWGA